MKLSVQPPELDEVVREMAEVLHSGQLTLGPKARQFEEEFAALVGVPYACAVSSGTAALEIALRARGIQGKEVLVPSNTFFATVAAVLHAGGTPRFVDCDPDTLDMDFESLVRRWRSGCVAVIVVHVGGPVAPCVEAAYRFALERGVFLLEDAAHAHGSTLHGKAAGSFGDAAAFSFYPTKVMTSGEGGMLVTANERLHSEALLYRDQGKESFSSNCHARLGYNWRMSELHAVLGRSQLKSLPSKIAARRQVAQWYHEALGNTGEIGPLPLHSASQGNFYKYPVLLPGSVPRSEVKRRLKQEWGVSLSGEVYEIPCHRQPVFRRYADGEFPGADEACRRHVCLPLYPGLAQDEVNYVAEALHVVVESLAMEVAH